MKNVYIMVPQHNETNGFLPWAFFYLKTYYETHGEEEMNWTLPLVGYRTEEEWWEHIQENKPDVFGIGCYLWNTQLCYNVAKRVKEKWPDVLIVGGGPDHNFIKNKDFFVDNPYIDLLIPFEGERPFTDILNMFNSGKSDWPECMGVVYPTNDGWKRSPQISYIPKSSDEWPTSVIFSQSELIKKCMKYFDDRKTTYTFHYETARGCPYMCAFCDWGGGTFSKLRMKQVEMVNRELAWISENKVSFLNIINANFGITEDDVDAATLIVDLKEEHGYPKRVDYLVPKRYTPKSQKIVEMFVEAGVLNKYVVGIQDVNREVLDNISRPDPGWDEHIKIFKKLANINRYIKLQLGGILGIPGQTLNTLKNDVDTFVSCNAPFPQFGAWVLLPNSPGAEKAFMDKFNVKTRKSLMQPFPSAAKANLDNTARHWGDARVVFNNHDSSQSVVEMVTSTSSFDEEEYMEMAMFSSMAYAGHTGGIFMLFSKLLYHEYGIEYSEFYADLYEDFFKSFASGKIKDIYYKGKASYSTIITDEITVPLVTVANIHEDFPFNVSATCNWIFSLLLFSNEFHGQFEQWIEKKYPSVDIDQLKDLVIFNKKFIYNIDHNPYVPIPFNCEYDWLTWKEQFEEVEFPGEREIQSPKKEKCRYRVLDETTKYLAHVLPIEWHTKKDDLEKLLDFYYKTSYGAKDERHFRNIVRI